MHTTSNSASVCENGFFGQECPVDILTMEKSVSTSVPVLLVNVITSRDVETGQEYVF